MKLDRAAWSQEEQFQLLKVQEQLGCNSWAMIAGLLNKKFIGKFRNGKQCRHRYIHHLQIGTNREQNFVWGKKECQNILGLFKKFGSKWSVISRQMAGWSENCLKNKFNGLLNRLLRKMNSRYEGDTKEVKSIIRIQSVKNIINCFDKVEKNQEIFGMLKQNLKEMVLDLAYKVSQNLDELEELESLKKEIHIFNAKNRILIMRKGRKKGKANKNLPKQQQKLQQELFVLQGPEQLDQKRCFDILGVNCSQTLDTGKAQNLNEQNVYEKDLTSILREYEEIRIHKSEKKDQNFDREVCEIMNEDYLQVNSYDLH